MSYPTHLLCRNGHYYYKAKVPVDLQQFFPQLFIKKSLKTTDLPTAKTALLSLEYQVKKVFTLLRTGMLDDGIVRTIVEEISPAKEAKGKASVKGLAEPKGHLLSKMIKQYMEFKEPAWTPKCQSALKIDPPSASKIDPPQVAVFSSLSWS